MRHLGSHPGPQGGAHRVGLQDRQARVLEERLEVDPGRQRVDDRRFVRPGHLHEAELRPECALAQELGVDRDVGLAQTDDALPFLQLMPEVGGITTDEDCVVESGVAR